MPKVFSSSSLKAFLTGGIVCLGLVAAIPTGPTHAQSNSSVETDLIQEVLPFSGSLLAAIREAPLSQLFSVTMPSGATGYGVKDQDFDPR